MAEHTLTDLLQRVARRANLRNNGAHILRHTFCSHLAMRGAPVRAIQELAGHRDLSTTQRYMHLSPNAIDDAIRLLDLALQARSGVETSLWRRLRPESEVSTSCDLVVTLTFLSTNRIHEWLRRLDALRSAR